jgi:hypothetical protein
MAVVELGALIHEPIHIRAASGFVGFAEFVVSGAVAGKETVAALQVGGGGFGAELLVALMGPGHLVNPGQDAFEFVDEFDAVPGAFSIST